VDQILGLSWKVLFPLAALNLLVTAAEVLALGELFRLRPGEALPVPALLAMAVINIGVFLIAAVALSNLLRPRERELRPSRVLIGG
jgi:hypothetical protein